eukprot:1899931-Karenia_brevis.AAC.1
MIAKGHRAWPKHGGPRCADIAAIFAKHPNTVPLAVSRQGCFDFNELALAALFPREAQVGTLTADVESNPENYDECGVMKPLSELRPSKMPIFIGMKVFITRNLNKDTDFINGMACLVDGYDRVNDGLRLVTETGKRLT